MRDSHARCARSLTDSRRLRVIIFHIVVADARRKPERLARRGLFLCLIITGHCDGPWASSLRQVRARIPAAAVASSVITSSSVHRRGSTMSDGITTRIDKTFPDGQRELCRCLFVGPLEGQGSVGLGPRAPNFPGRSFCQGLKRGSPNGAAKFHLSLLIS